MHFFGSHFATDEKDAMIIFDIGSGHISCAVTVYTAQKKPHIVYATTEPIDAATESQEQLLKAMISSLLVVTMRVRSEGIPLLSEKFGITAKKLVCVFSSPWYAAYTKTICKQYTKHELISRQTVDALLHDEKVLLTTSEGKNGKLIECAATGVRLNGYDTSLEKKLEASYVEIDTYISFISEDIISKVEAVLSKMFNPQYIDLATYPYIAVSALGVLRESRGVSLYVDIAAQTTDIVLHDGKALLRVSSVPCGKHSFVSAIQTSLKTNEYDAMTRFTLTATKKYAKGKEADVATKHVEKIATQWREAIASTLSQVESEYPLFTSVSITADDAIVPFFSEQLIEALSPVAGESYIRHIPITTISRREVSAFLTTHHDVQLDGTLGLCVLFYADSTMR